MSKPPSGNYSRTRGNPATVPRAGRVVPPSRSGRHFSGDGGSPESPARQGSSGGRGGGSLYRQGKREVSGISSAAPKLAAEYLLCVVLITAGAMTKPGGYLDRMTEILWRVSAVTALFFVLALASMSTVASKLTVQFGALIVVAILLMQVKTISRTFNVLAGQGSGDTTDTLDAAVKTPEVKPNLLT